MLFDREAVHLIPWLAGVLMCRRPDGLLRIENADNCCRRAVQLFNQGDVRDLMCVDQQPANYQERQKKVQMLQSQFCYVHSQTVA